MQIGNLRADIELIKPGRHGNYYMLFDPSSEHYFKIGDQAALILSRLDQPYELDAFLARLQRTGVRAEKQDVLQLVGFLVQNNLLAPGYGQIEMQQKKMLDARNKTWLIRWASIYMFFKFPPLRPARFLAAVKPYTDWMVSSWMLWSIMIPALLGYVLMLRDFSAVRTMFIDSLSWAGLAKYFAAIVVLKVVHECAHALAANHYGCKVRAVGVSLIVFYPRIFSDTTDSWRLPRYQRLLIDAAGIFSEILLGGLAALLWCYLPPGVWKSTMFYTFAVSSISTLFANGNPLIRYDGYYILCDLLNVENLMFRSSEYVRAWFRWGFFGVGERPSEPRWILMLVFGIAAFIYKIFLYSAIILIIYGAFVKTIAVVMLFLEVYTIFIFPLWRELRTVQILSKKAASRAWCWRVLLVLAGLAAVLLFPLSWDVTLPGAISPAHREQIVTQESGVLLTTWPRSGRSVVRGSTLYRLGSPQLQFGLERFAWMARGDEQLYHMQQLDRESFGDSLLTREKWKSDLIGIQEMTRRQEKLAGFAPTEGVFIPFRDDLSQGVWFPAGMRIGELVSTRSVVHAYADDRQVQKLKVGTRATVYVPDSLYSMEAVITELDRIPAKLQNSPLLQIFGGPLPVYPDETKPGEYISVDALYRVELAFTGPFSPQLMGRTVRVQVHHKERLGEKILAFVYAALRREF